MSSVSTITAGSRTCSSNVEGSSVGVLVSIEFPEKSGVDCVLNSWSGHQNLFWMDESIVMSSSLSVLVGRCMYIENATTAL